MQAILVVAVVVGAIWLVVGPVQEGFWLAGSRRSRLKQLRWNRRAGNPTGHWKGRYFDYQRTPSGAVRRWRNRVWAWVVAEYEKGPFGTWPTRAARGAGATVAVK